MCNVPQKQSSATAQVAEETGPVKGESSEGVCVCACVRACVRACVKIWLPRVVLTWQKGSGSMLPEPLSTQPKPEPHLKVGVWIQYVAL